MRALLAACVFFFLAGVASRAEAKRVFGAAIPDEVRRIDEGRFRSRRDWDRTLRFFRSVYRRTSGVVWRRIETPPNVKAIHIQNTKRKRKWDGINIYETKGGKVYIYVLRSTPKKK